MLKLPQCEQYLWQARVRKPAHIGHGDLGSPIDFAWRQDSGILVPVYFEGQSASHLINSQKCNCSLRQMCSTGCKCYLNVKAPIMYHTVILHRRIRITSHF